MKVVFMFFTAAVLLSPANVAPARAHLALRPIEEPDTIITIRASGSTLEFQPARLSVKTGRRVKLRFVNDGTLPHNVVMKSIELFGTVVAPAVRKAIGTGT